MRVAERRRHRVAIRELARVGRVRGIRVVAGGELLFLAEEALSAGDDEGHDDALPHFEFFVALADVHHLTHELMAEDVARFHARDHVIVQMQVRATDRGGSDADDRIARVHQDRIGHCFDANVLFALPCKCSHEIS
jgi:hypothetical protein